MYDFGAYEWTACICIKIVKVLFWPLVTFKLEGPIGVDSLVMFVDRQWLMLRALKTKVFYFHLKGESHLLMKAIIFKDQWLMNTKLPIELNPIDGENRRSAIYIIWGMPIYNA